RREGGAAVGRHGGEERCGQVGARRLAATVGTIGRQLAFGHRPHHGEWAAAAALIVVDGHWYLSGKNRTRAGTARRRTVRPRAATPPRYLSGDSGMGTPPFTCLIGPAALGITSKSKMSVGSHSVAQAFGIST